MALFILWLITAWLGVPSAIWYQLADTASVTIRSEKRSTLLSTRSILSCANSASHERRSV
jgi:hypothetical protein